MSVAIEAEGVEVTNDQSGGESFGSDEPEDLYSARQAAHALLDSLYLYLFEVRRVVALLESRADCAKSVAKVFSADKTGEDTAAAGSLIDCPPIRLQHFVEQIISDHRDFREKFAPISEEFAQAVRDIVTISGTAGRSYCAALDEWAWRVVHETFNGINRHTEPTDWDESLGSGDQHGFTLGNWLAVCLHLADALQSFDGPDTHEVIEHEFDRVWDARVTGASNQARTAAPRESQVSPDKDADNTSHSIDYRSVCWFGTEYSFTALQAACVRILWENWRNRSPEVGEQTILTQAESSQSRLANVFRNGGHPAWNTMIKGGSTRGSFRLVRPE